MALLGYSFGFLLALGIVAWIVFPRAMRALIIALCVFVGVAWIVGQTTQHQEQRERRE
jgi:glucose uptake protein GlcU